VSTDVNCVEISVQIDRGVACRDVDGGAGLRERLILREIEDIGKLNVGRALFDCTA